MTATERWYAARLGAVANDPVAAWRAAGADERTAEHWGGLNAAAPDAVLGFGATGTQPLGTHGPLAVAWLPDDNGRDYVTCGLDAGLWTVWWCSADMAHDSATDAEDAAWAAIEETGERWCVVHRLAPSRH